MLCLDSPDPVIALVQCAQRGVTSAEPLEAHEMTEGHSHVLVSAPDEDVLETWALEPDSPLLGCFREDGSEFP